MQGSLENCLYLRKPCAQLKILIGEWIWGRISFCHTLFEPWHHWECSCCKNTVTCHQIAWIWAGSAWLLQLQNKGRFPVTLDTLLMITLSVCTLHLQSEEQNLPSTLQSFFSSLVMFLGRVLSLTHFLTSFIYFQTFPEWFLPNYSTFLSKANNDPQETKLIRHFSAIFLGFSISGKETSFSKLSLPLDSVTQHSVRRSSF